MIHTGRDQDALTDLGVMWKRPACADRGGQVGQVGVDRSVWIRSDPTSDPSLLLVPSKNHRKALLSLAQHLRKMIDLVVCFCYPYEDYE